MLLKRSPRQIQRTVLPCIICRKNEPVAGIWSFTGRHHRIFAFLNFGLLFSYICDLVLPPFATAVKAEMGCQKRKCDAGDRNVALTIPARIIVGMVLIGWPAHIYSCLLIYAVLPCLALQ